MAMMDSPSGSLWPRQLMSPGASAQQLMSPVNMTPVAGGLGWPEAGLVLFAFAAPSAVMAVPYLIGTAGYLGGLLICVVVTGASVGGSMMLLRIKLMHQSCHTFGDLGREVLGRPGQLWGNIIQLGNFCMFLPCALEFCALALSGIGKGFSAFGGCTDYYLFTIALLCLLTTQVRKLSNTVVLTFVSVVSVYSMSLCMLIAAFSYDNPQKLPAQNFGNPEADATLQLVKAAGGFTIAAWAYVPSFLTVELVTCMESPADFRKSLYLSATMNILMVAVVGVPVVARWGYNVGEVIGITDGVAAWKPGVAINTFFNTFQLIGNFVSYMLDSVPLGRFCQKAWAPQFGDTWSSAHMAQYLGYTLPTFILALALAVLVPSVNTLLDFTTALTVPMVTQIYPATLYWRLFCQSGVPLARESLREHPEGQSDSPDQKTTPMEKCGVLAVFVVGCTSFVVCMIKAVGFLALEELRPPMQIGCGDWTIWSSR